MDVGRLDVIWKPGGTTHENRYPRGGRSFLVEFAEGWWEDPHAIPAGEPWAGEGLPASTLLVLRALAFSDSGPLDLEVDELVAVSVDHVRAAFIDGSVGPRHLETVREHLRATIASPPRLAEVAAAVQLHPSHLCRLFRRQFGCTMGEYVRRIRIGRALDLLTLQPDRSLSGLACRLGYADQSHFTRDFRRLVGIPPGRYVSTSLARMRKDRSRRDT